MAKSSKLPADFVNLAAIRSAPFAAWLSLALLLTMAAFALLFVHHQDEVIATSRFDQEAMKVSTAISRRLAEYEMALRGSAGLFAASSDGVTRRQWKEYVDNLRIDSLFPGLRGIGYVEVLPATGLAAHERRVRAEGFPNYHVEPRGNRADYAVVLYVEPFDAQNQRVFGHDLWSVPASRAAMIQARDTGNAALSGKMPLLSDRGGQNAPGVQMFWPVYRKGMPLSTVQARRDALTGYVYASFRVNDLIQGTLGNRMQLSYLSIFDGAQATADHLLYGSFKHPETAFHKEMPLNIAGRPWLLSVTNTAAFQPQMWNTSKVLGFVLVAQLVALIFILQLVSIRARRREQQSVAEIARQAQMREERFRMVVEASPNAIVVTNGAGRIELVNAQVEKMFGYSRTELLGQSVEMLVPERYRQGHPTLRHHFVGQPSTRPMGAGRDLFARHKNGKEMPIEIGLNPIRTDEGLLVLSSIIDISERKAAEARVKEQAERIQKISDEITRQTKLREERFRLVIDASPNAIIVINASGQIELVNAQVEKLTGYNRQELLGQHIEMLIPERFRSEHPGLREHFVAAPSARPMGAGRDLSARHKDGREIPVEIGLNPIQTDEGLLVLSSIIDISERKAAEERMRQQNEEIAAASRYKSEFLANMSHELRTPLNSILILSEQLTANMQGNLTPKQVSHADIIHRSGRDLLNLINDILDLSKIEAGRMTIMLERIDIVEFAESLDQAFRPMAEAKDLALSVKVEPDTTREVQSDHQRIFQIIRNLFSNALKFTKSGEIRIRLFNPPATLTTHGKHLLAIAVTDTGIGIPADKHGMIFEAFQQVDGSISRRYGGTGLGLTISRQLADLLGGHIEVDSEIGKGSTFTLYLPDRTPEAKPEAEPARDPAAQARPPLPEPAVAANGNGEGNLSVLVIESDPGLAQAIAKAARAYGLSPRVVRTGAEGLHVVQTSPPAAIILDLRLPDTNGWVVLHELKNNPDCRRLPIQVISGVDHPSIMFDGMVGYLVKPIAIRDLERAFAELRALLREPLKRILLVEDNPVECEHYARLIGELGYDVTVCTDARAALKCCREGTYGCMVIDLNLPDMSGFELLDQLKREHLIEGVGIIINTGIDLGDEELQKLRQYSAIVLTKATSEQRLVNAVRIHLNALAGTPAPMPAAMLPANQPADVAATPIAGKHVLVVDDDIRNIYAMCSVLEDMGLETATTSNGEEALRFLEQHQEIDLVLMDMMMPVLDGYAATHELKFNRHYDKPIVALTAHAMRGDREKCLEAGADDYLAKPVTNADLFQMLKKWLAKS